jgi:hypothetical protein
MKNKLLLVFVFFLSASLHLISQNKTTSASTKRIKILDFYGDNGFVHHSKLLIVKLKS